MALSGSLYTGLSALNGFARGIEVTGNNIANANTYGFKSQRIEYKDSFYNTLNRSVAGDAGFGVTSTANQVGTGLDARTIMTDFNQGLIDSTGIDTDIAILGSGFFKTNDVVAGGDEFNEFFTRAGNFRVDSNGFLVTQDGKFVQGLTIGDETATFTVEGTSDGLGTPADGFEIAAADIDTIAGSATEGQITATTLTLPSTFNGGKGYLDTANGLPEITIIGDGMGAEATAIVVGGVVIGVTITNPGMGYSNAVIRIEAPPANNLRYTKLTEPDLGDVGSIKIVLPTFELTDNTNGDGVQAANVIALAPGMQSVAIEPDGTIKIYLDNGENITIGRLLLQDFRAPQALRRIEGGYFVNDNETAGAIGEFDAAINGPGGPGLGFLRQGSLELSNTSMTDQFANLIINQRAFQGAARVITTADDILREAINLKR